MKNGIAALSLAVISSLAFAQASAPADKAKSGPPKPAASAPGPQGGMGPGMGPRGRMMSFDKSNTPGWLLMTLEERAAHRERMRSIQTVAECKAYHDEHRTQMDARAKEMGQTARPFRGDPCAMMQKRGIIR